MPLAHAERISRHGGETREAQEQAGKQLKGVSAAHLFRASLLSWILLLCAASTISSRGL